MARTLLAANLDLYANQTTGSNSNPGTAALPFADPGYAYQYVQQNYDLGGQYTVTCHLQSNFTGVAWSFVGALTGAQSPKSFVIDGGGASTTVSGSAGVAAITVSNLASIRATNFTMVPGARGYGFLAFAPGSTIVVDNAFGTTNSAHAMFDAAGTGVVIIVTGFYLTENGGHMDYVAVVEDQANIVLNGFWTLNGGCTWNNAFVQADLGGMIDATGLTWQTLGGCAGYRFNAVAPGIVFTGVGGGPPFFFPGSVNGLGGSPWYQ